MSAPLMLMVTRPGDRLRRDTIADMLWPNLSIQSARNNLRHTFVDLREALVSDSQEPFLLFDRDWLSFNSRSDLWMDAVEIATAASRSATPDVAKIERRARLYRGELMAGFSLPDCPEFEDWLEAQRGGLARQAVALLEYLAPSHKDAGHLDRALERTSEEVPALPAPPTERRRVTVLYCELTLAGFEDPDEELRAVSSLFRSRRDSGTRKLLEELTAHFDERADLPGLLHARTLARGVA